MNKGHESTTMRVLTGLLALMMFGLAGLSYAAGHNALGEEEKGDRTNRQQR